MLAVATCNSMDTIYTMKMPRKITTSNIKWGTAALACDCGQCNVYIVVEPVLHTNLNVICSRKVFFTNEWFFFFKNKSPSLLVFSGIDSAAYCLQPKAFNEIERRETEKKYHENEHTPVDITYSIWNNRRWAARFCFFIVRPSSEGARTIAYSTIKWDTNTSSNLAYKN